MPDTPQKIPLSGFTDRLRRQLEQYGQQVNGDLLHEALAQVMRHAVPAEFSQDDRRNTAKLPLEWKQISYVEYRADAPLFGSIRAESYNGGTEWLVNWSAPGISDTLIEGEWDNPEAAMKAAEDHVSSAISLHAGRMAKLEIDALRQAIVRYGDKSRMGTVEPMNVQQAIDRAFEESHDV